MWKGYGSFLFFDAGEPQVRFRDVKTSAVVNGTEVPRRSATVRGTRGLQIEMADWTLSYRGADVAHSESSNETFAGLTRWLTGQALVGVTACGTASVELEFDLGAVLRVRPSENFGATHEIVTVRDGRRYLSLRADGTTVVEG